MELCKRTTDRGEMESQPTKKGEHRHSKQYSAEWPVLKPSKVSSRGADVKFAGACEFTK